MPARLEAPERLRAVPVKRRDPAVAVSPEKVTFAKDDSPYDSYDPERAARLCDSGLPDMDVCDFIQTPPVEADALSEAWSRGRWLLGLLVLQSTSSMVLVRYEQLLKDHLVVTLFLTMLVGAGGNAGNQSAIKVIRGLATGTIQTTNASIRRTLSQQALIALLLGTGLSVGGFVRVYVTNGSIANSVAISTSLFLIVMTSVLTGTALPFALARMGIDPANAGTSIQVLMDILGVAITCVTCDLILSQFAASLPT
ncbi:hypothetical protein WJX72_006883 [[Myrmecia] bisecta]|uniref:SLC41A/MgtE integral membrane domain-containing protein n=1 Tax=[Myrmecia] bisecta TaxID=41462 RepID=A0AAW1PQ58_9CHLO